MLFIKLYKVVLPFEFVDEILKRVYSSESILIFNKIKFKLDFFHYLSHELLSCEHELMVNHPSGLLLKQTAVRMNHHRLQKATTTNTSPNCLCL